MYWEYFLLSFDKNYKLKLGPVWKAQTLYNSTRDVSSKKQNNKSFTGWVRKWPLLNSPDRIVAFSPQGSWWKGKCKTHTEYTGVHREVSVIRGICLCAADGTRQNHIMGMSLYCEIGFLARKTITVFIFWAWLWFQAYSVVMACILIGARIDMAFTSRTGFSFKE